MFSTLKEHSQQGWLSDYLGVLHVVMPHVCWEDYCSIREFRSAIICS